MIEKYKMKGIATNRNELIGYFAKGGISESLSFLDRLLEETKTRINNQNIFVVLILFIIHLLYQSKKLIIKNK